VGFSHPGRPQKDDVLSVRDKPALRELSDPFLVDRRLEGEVERLEGLDVGKLSEGGPEGDVFFLLGGDLLGEDLVQEVGVGDTVLGRLLKGRLEAFLDPVEPEMAEVVLDAGEAHWRPPSSNCS